MGRKRKGRYIIEWWIGDHGPKHVHIFDSSGEFMGRIILKTMMPMEAWNPSRDLIAILHEMVRKGEL